MPSRTGQDYRVVGGDIVLIETATNLVLDVMQGVLR
jgi:Ni/Co efflux regulator RcnB